MNKGKCWEPVKSVLQSLDKMRHDFTDSSNSDCIYIIELYHNYQNKTRNICLIPMHSIEI